MADACRELAYRSSPSSETTTGSPTARPTSSRALAEAGVVVLERTHTILPVNGVKRRGRRVKGFVGGFGQQWANFGEPLFREAYAETTKRRRRPRDAGWRDRACAVRIAPLHNRRSKPPSRVSRSGSGSCSAQTVWPADPPAPPHLVVHGHAHRARSRDVHGVPVYNVAVHVIGREFWVFASPPSRRGGPAASGARRRAGQQPTTLQIQRRGRDRSSSMNRTRCHGPYAELAVADRDRLAGRPEEHRHAVGVPVRRPPCPPGRCSPSGAPSRRARSRFRAGLGVRRRAVKSSNMPRSYSFTRTQQVVCGRVDAADAVDDARLAHDLARRRR